MQSSCPYGLRMALEARNKESRQRSQEEQERQQGEERQRGREGERERERESDGVGLDSTWEASTFRRSRAYRCVPRRYRSSVLTGRLHALDTVRHKSLEIPGTKARE